MNVRTSSAALFLVFLTGCTGSERPTLPGLALQLEFEDTCEPVAVADLAAEIPEAGLSFGPGVEGRAARFDGSGAELKFSGLAALGLSRSMTLEFFVNIANWKNPYAAGSGLESLVSHSDDFTVAVDPHSWKLQARLRTSASEDALRLSGGIVSPGTWHHVALILDGEQGRARLVLDGEEVSHMKAQGNLVVQPNLHLVVGTWFKRNQAFCGALDSIRLWQRALTPDELSARASKVMHGGVPAGLDG